jgi:catechol 2,3-dioxygenase-like lactoylglutathione lyase family enzyme
VYLFHYHLVTSRVRQVEARYVGKLGFDLVARHGRIGEDYQSFEPGTSWEDLDALGFKLRLTELERGAVNVVVQPGQWDLPRVDHLGLALDEDEFDAVVDRAATKELRIQAHGGRRTFVATNAGYRLELHPPQEWLDELLESATELARRRAGWERGAGGARNSAVFPGGPGRSPGAARRALHLNQLDMSL